MGKTKIVASIEKLEIAQLQAGEKATQDEIAKFYLDPSLAKVISKVCSIEVFRFLHDQSKEFNNPAYVEPVLDDFGLSLQDFKIISRNYNISSILGGLAGWSTFIYLFLLIDESFSFLTVIGLTFPSVLFIFPFSSVFKNAYLIFSNRVKRCIVFCQSFRAYSQNNISFWQHLSWQQFEVEICKRFNNARLNAKVTKGTGDRGVDIYMYLNNKKIIVQCKKYNKPVGPAVVRELTGAIVSESANLGIIIGLSGFTKGAYDATQGLVLLWSIEDFISMTENDLISLLKNKVSD